ncbi:hypothetical protein CWI84_08505 [Idiomarina tyrosinivorans]|uniref:Putative manganese efflux pump MntP n=1 Tax=Idiomarina tyrosinivorans TaxID=1445662 RepID=A0A432ZQ13_9GAMM|nr:manganese efflux pump MntP [Idiomarina tyrosinivorans]RUO79990.1 hypothetical protein CWI84_08505 [Idiomarina tyrosinivorans]
MHIVSLLFIALAMSTDAFAVAVGKGAALKTPRLSLALRTGLLFGVVEGSTPVIGWLLGRGASHWVSEWDHWIAFALLVGLGLRMIKESFSEDDDEDDKPRAAHASLPILLLTAVATSIDALAVGIGLAFVDVNIALAALLIGCATFIMVTIGIMLGRYIGGWVGKRAELVGGLVLIVIGASVLYQHIG